MPRALLEYNGTLVIGTSINRPLALSGSLFHTAGALSEYVIPITTAHFARATDAANTLFRVRAILDRLNKGETSVKLAPELLYFII